MLFFLDHKADADLVKDMLAERRFEDVDRAYENLLSLRNGPVKGQSDRTQPAASWKRSRRCCCRRSSILPIRTWRLTNLERFLAVIGTRSSYYALLAENRETFKLLVSLFGMSEFLSKILIGHPELLDSLVARSDASSVKSKEAMASGPERPAGAGGLLRGAAGRAAALPQRRIPAHRH